MVGIGWEMVGVYPIYVLQAGAFLAGAFLFFAVPFPNKCLFGCFCNQVFLFIMTKGKTPTSILDEETPAAKNVDAVKSQAAIFQDMFTGHTISDALLRT